MDLNETLIFLGKGAGIIIIGLIIFYSYSEYQASKRRKDKKIKILFNQHPNFQELIMEFKQKAYNKPTFGNYRNNKDYLSPFESLINVGYSRSDVNQFRKNIREELKEIEMIPSEREKIQKLIRTEYKYHHKKERIKTYLRSKIDRNVALYEDFVKKLEKRKESLTDEIILYELKRSFNLNEKECLQEFNYITDHTTGLIYKHNNDEYFFPWGTIKYERIDQESRRVIRERLGYNLSI